MAFGVFKETARIWHERLGHINSDYLKEMIKNETVSGISIKNVEDFKCETCDMVKLTKQPFNTSKTIYKNALELVHSDLVQFGGEGRENNRYVVTFVDQYTKFICAYTISNKSDTFEAFKMYHNFVERQSGEKLKTLRTDNGTEYLSREFKKLFTKIRYQT